MRSSGVFLVVVRTPASVAHDATISATALSTATAQVETSSIHLQSTGELDVETAADGIHYQITVNGGNIPVESASYNAANHSVTLALPKDALSIGDAVTAR